MCRRTLSTRNSCFTFFYKRKTFEILSEVLNQDFREGETKFTHIKFLLYLL